MTGSHLTRTGYQQQYVGCRWRQARDHTLGRRGATSGNINTAACADASANRRPSLTEQRVSVVVPADLYELTGIICGGCA
jgi:hypothetical protein